MLRRLFRLCVCVSFAFSVRKEGNGKERKVPLLRNVRHSFPAIPPTSDITTVDAPRVTAPVPPVACVTAAVVAIAAALEVAAACFLFGAAETDVDRNKTMAVAMNFILRYLLPLIGKIVEVVNN